MVGSFIGHGLLDADHAPKIQELIMNEIVKYGQDRCKFQRAICANIFLTEEVEVHKKIMHAEEPKL